MSYLYARDLAARLRIGLSTARRRLARLEREHGATVVGRMGGALFTTDAALARVLPAWASSKSDAARLDRLEESVARLWRHQRAGREEQHELRAQIAKFSTLFPGIVRSHESKANADV